MTTQNQPHKLLSKIDSSTPFLAIDLSCVSRKYEEINRALPFAKIFYAVKCNPEAPILQMLADKGSSFEVASLGELKRLISIGIDPKDVIYSNPVKPEQDIKAAYNLGLNNFAFDSPEELAKIANAAPASRVHLRVSISNKGSQINLSSKFGANRLDSLELIKLARKFNLVPYGITFHVGSQAEDINIWDEAFKDISFLLRKLQTEGILLEVLNIGGGFPVQYGVKAPSIDKIGSVISRNLPNLPYAIKIWCEPGRFLVAEAGTIGTRVIGRATRHNDDWLYLSVGRFQAFIELFESEDIRYPVFSSNATSKKRQTPFVLTGPTCDSYDTILHDVLLPSDTTVDDVVYFAMAGAYTHVYGAAFNDFPVPRVVYV